MKKKYKFQNSDNQGNVINFEDEILFEDQNEMFLFECGLEYNPQLGCFVGSNFDKIESSKVNKAFQLREMFLWHSFTDYTYDENNDRGVWFEKYRFLPKNYTKINKQLTIGVYHGHSFIRMKYDDSLF